MAALRLRREDEDLLDAAIGRCQMLGIQRKNKAGRELSEEEKDGLWNGKWGVGEGLGVAGSLSPASC